MTTRFRLRELLETRGISQTELQMQTRLAYSTISALVHNKTFRVELETLDVLCAALSCDISDLLEYQPAGKRARGGPR